MAKTAVDAQLWLPLEILGNKENGYKVDLYDAEFGFPSEFPYEFGVSSPTVESVAWSTETESSDEEEDFLAGLTRRLSLSQSTQQKHLPTAPIRKAPEPGCFTTKTRDLAGSPQSILSGIGSWSGRSTVSGDGSPNGLSRVPSPSTAPFADPWEVIYAAAGQVARLKMNGQVSQLDFQNTLVGPTSGNIFSNQSLTQVQNQQRASVWGRQGNPNWLSQQQQLQVHNKVLEFGYEHGKSNRLLSLPHSGYPPLQNQRVHLIGSRSRVSVPGGSSVNRGCGGTGVFLPRHYETPSVSSKKTACAPVMLPAKPVRALNSNIDGLNVTTQQHFSNAFATDYDSLLARRNALVMQQRLNARREQVANSEIRLPQEWTY